MDDVAQVVAAIDKATKEEFAIKILDKNHILREKKTKYVHVEKTVLARLHHPLLIRLHSTFQDASCLCIYFARTMKWLTDGMVDFVLDLAENGELLGMIKKVAVRSLI